MSQYQTTLDAAQLQSLFQNDGRRPLLEHVLNQVLQAQVSQQISAQPHQRSEERTAYCSGYRERDLTARIGTLTLRVPKPLCCRV